jgi:DNA-binding IclR family transcriptional regulator
MLDGNAVRSVDRAASLLIALGETQGEAGVTELARRLGLHKSTASRLLATLQKRGLVEQDDDSGKYRLGLAVVRLGGHAERSLDLRAIAMSELESLAKSIRETTTLEVLEGDTRPDDRLFGRVRHGPRPHRPELAAPRNGARQGSPRQPA